MTIIKQGENYIVNFNLFSDAVYSANNVIGTLTYNPLELELVDIVVAPAIGTRSLIDPDNYLFGSVLPNKHYVAACEFKILDEKLVLPVEWSITTSSNEVNLSNNSTGINLVEYLNGVLAEDLALLVADGKLFITDVDVPFTGAELPVDPGDILNDTQLRKFNNGIVVAYKWDGLVWDIIYSFDWGERRICLNTSVAPFAPLDIYNPTLAEVVTWVTTNYPTDTEFRRNGTQLVYYTPDSLGNSTATNNCTSPTHVWTLSDAVNPVTLTYKRRSNHINDAQNVPFTGVEVPTVDGEIYGDTATVLFSNNRVVNYTWFIVSWGITSDMPVNTYNTTHMLNELNFPVVATNYVGGTESVLAAADGVLTITPIYLGKLALVTGVQYMLDGVLGDYTGNNYNGIGLYHYNPTLARLELLEKTANDLNIWKDPIEVIQTKSFENPVNLYPGLYYIGFLYNQSAEVTAPGFVAVAASSKFLSGYIVDNVELKTLQYSGKNSLPLVIQTTDANTPINFNVYCSLI